MSRQGCPIRPPFSTRCCRRWAQEWIGNDGLHGPQLWSSAGTATTTQPLTHLSGVPSEPFPIAIALLNTGGSAYFAVPLDADPTRWSLLRTTGLPGSTRSLSGLPSIGESVAGLTLMAGDDSHAFIVSYDDDAANNALFRYPPGSNRLTRLRSNLHVDRTAGLLVASNLLLFGNDDGSHGTEPWVSNGTPAGTRLLKDLYP